MNNVKFFRITDDIGLSKGFLHIEGQETTLKIVIPTISRYHSSKLQIFSNLIKSTEKSLDFQYNPFDNIELPLQITIPGLFYVKFKLNLIESQLNIMVDPIISLKQKLLHIKNINIGSIMINDRSKFEDLKNQVSDLSKQEFNIIYLRKDDNKPFSQISIEFPKSNNVTEFKQFSEALPPLKPLSKSINKSSKLVIPQLKPIPPKFESSIKNARFSSTNFVDNQRLKQDIAQRESDLHELEKEINEKQQKLARIEAKITEREEYLSKLENELSKIEKIVQRQESKSDMNIYDVFDHLGKTYDVGFMTDINLQNIDENEMKKLVKISSVICIDGLDDINEERSIELIDKIRSIKPNIYITAKTKRNDIDLILKYKLNSIVKDVNFSNAFDASKFINEYSNLNFASIKNANNFIELSNKIPIIIESSISLISVFSMLEFPIILPNIEEQNLALVQSLNKVHSCLENFENQVLTFGNILSMLKMNQKNGNGFYLIYKFADSYDTPKKLQIPVENIDFAFEYSQNIYHGNSSNFARIENNEIIIENLPENSIIVYQTSYTTSTLNAIKKLENSYIEKYLDEYYKDLSLFDMNNLIFRGEGEEKGYDIDEINFSGITGILDFYENHESKIINHMIEGNWLIDYSFLRLFRCSNLINLSHFLRKELIPYKNFKPKQLIPLYFFKLMKQIYDCFIKNLYSRLSAFSMKDNFIRDLSVLSISIFGNTGESRFLSDRMNENSSFGPKTSLKERLSSIRGVLLVTGRFEDAKKELLIHAQDALDCGNACFAFLYPQAVQDYFYLCPKGKYILYERCMNGRTILYYIFQIIERYAKIERIKSEALLASSLTWLEKCFKEKIIKESTICGIRFNEYYDNISNSFEQKYYLANQKYDGSIEEILYSMSVSPELFDRNHALFFLSNIHDNILNLSFARDKIPNIVGLLIKSSAKFNRKLTEKDFDLIKESIHIVYDSKKFGCSTYSIASLIDGYFEFCNR